MSTMFKYVLLASYLSDLAIAKTSPEISEHVSVSKGGNILKYVY